MEPALYTIGHSNRPFEDFLALLQANDIRLLVDIRTLPGSKKYPHFDKENFEAVLPTHQIAYCHMPQLGGRRAAKKDSINTGWRHKAFRGYADYMQTEAFVEGADQLADLAQKQATAIMCSEAVPWRCHRSMVADAMLVRGFAVLDIISKTSVRPHKLTPWAVVDGTEITYPAPPEPVQMALGLSPAGS